MAQNITSKLVWIVQTINTAHKITFQELNDRWQDNEEMSGGEAMLKRTFHKWKNQIFELFGLIIESEKTAPYYYYIVNEEDLKRGSVESWLLSTFSVSNSLIESKSIKNRILLEDVPSGGAYLDSIIEAMKKNRIVNITYYSYWRNESREYELMPLCVKLFRQRWYMVGRSMHSGSDHLYCLDRIREFSATPRKFTYPEDFAPADYFYGSFGIIPDQSCEVEDVELKVSAGQSNYLRDLPMHESQREVERNEDYSIFKLRIRPTYDFQQELLWNREELEVLKPLWLRKEMVGIIKRMGQKYK